MPLLVNEQIIDLGEVVLLLVNSIHLTPDSIFVSPCPTPSKFCVLTLLVFGFLYLLQKCDNYKLSQ